jgi:ketosteroid isomerase-like protein
MQLTAGQTFYNRLWAAIEARDFVAVEKMYRPAAVQYSLNTGDIFEGRAAIMASLQEFLAIAGPITPKAVESFVELEDIVCVEAVQATRFAEVRNYDIYLLYQGRISKHFSGTIAPRTPASPLLPGPPATPEQQLHRDYYAAFQAQDFARLAALFRPDAISVAVSVGAVTRGRDAIIGNMRPASSEGMMFGSWTDAPRLESITRFMTAPNVVCAEGTFSQKVVYGPLNFEFYEIYILRDGGIQLSFSGLISPRPDELKQILERLGSHRVEMGRIVLEGITVGRRRWL